MPRCREASRSVGPSRTQAFRAPSTFEGGMGMQVSDDGLPGADKEYGRRSVGYFLIPPLQGEGGLRAKRGVGWGLRAAEKRPHPPPSAAALPRKRGRDKKDCAASRKTSDGSPPPRRFAASLPLQGRVKKNSHFLKNQERRTAPPSFPRCSRFAANGRLRSWRRRSRPGCGSRRRAFAGWPRHGPSPSLLTR